jgi:Domain of unknown function (DUF4150)/GHH signature containing HNH/Endo VII superfamily nuclease toxin  2
MRTHVYANELEIAAKAVGGDGISPAAFPDPCWSPPAPTAGPIVLPYPNTCEATHIRNGSQTVFICGQQVGQEDKSYFSQSTGNEAATQAFNKGVATGVITGKAHFTQWSFDVRVEGFGVPRHQDLVTHNHGSMPANTPTFPYLSRGLLRNDCRGEEGRLKRACAPEKEDSDSRKAIKSKSKVRQLLKGKKEDGDGKKGKYHWTDDHCDGLDTMLSRLEQGKAYADKMEEVVKNLPGELDILGALEQELKEMVTHAGAKALGTWAAKAGVKQLAGTSVPAVGNALMAIWSVADAAMAIGDINEIRRVAAESLEKLKMLRGKIGDLQDLAKEFENFSKLDDAAKLEKGLEVAGQAQDTIATLNDCTRARKCMLTPFSSSPEQRGRDHSQKGGGCCDGQTGHHLVTGAMLEGACPGYKREPPGDQMHKDAPTVCVEGYSHTVGSHKRIHKNMDKQIKNIADIPAGMPEALQDGTMSMDQAIEAAAKSHQESFPASKCSKECIKNQLESYYKKACPGTRPKALNTTNGKPVTPEGNNIE